MIGTDSFWLAGALAVAGIIVLRFSWARRSRSMGLNATGWAFLLAGIVVGVAGEGAWGIAVASLFAIGTALILLLKAVFEQPRWKRAARTFRQPANTQVPNESRPVGKLATFAITGLLSLVAVVLFALAARLALLAMGASEADGNVSVLGLVPLIWPLLVFTLLMTESRKVQLTVVGLIVTASLSILILAGGSA